MTIESRAPGWEAELRATGIGRYFVAGFLLLWLGGWLFGEVAAIGALMNLAVTDSLEEAGPVRYIALGFLSIWLLFWTGGGLGALHLLLRLVASTDRLVVSSNRITILRRPGIFRRRQSIDAADIEHFELKPDSGAIVALMRSGLTVQLTSFGRAEEREALLDRLQAWLGEVEGEERATQRDAGAPPGWEIDLDADLAVLLRRSDATRGFGTLVRAAVAIGCLLWVLRLYDLGLLHGTTRSASQQLFAALLATVSILATAGALHRAFGMDEWCFLNGKAEFRSRYFKRVLSERYVNPVLELTVRVPGDGIERQSLTIRSGSMRRKITSSVGPAAEQLAYWISEHGGIPLETSRPQLALR